jgi:protein TonB
MSFRRNIDRTFAGSFLLALMAHGGALALLLWQGQLLVLPRIEVEGGTGSGWAETEFAGNAGREVSRAVRLESLQAPISSDRPTPVEADIAVESPAVQNAPKKWTSRPVLPSQTEGVPQWIGVPPSGQTNPPSPMRRPALAASATPTTDLQPAPAYLNNTAADASPGIKTLGVIGPESRSPGAGQGGGLPTPRSGNKPPRYPAEALRNHWEGTAILNVRVLPDGSVGEVLIKTSSGHDVLDQAAVQAVRHWHFNPMTLDGRSGECEVDQPVRFVLEP